MNLRDRLKGRKGPPPIPPLPKASKASPPPIPPHAAAQLAAAPPERKRRDVQEVIVGNERPATLEALEDAIVRLSDRLLQKVHLIVSRTPMSPLTWLQSQQLRAEIGLHSTLVAAAARWFERYRRKERSIEVDAWPEDEPTLKMKR